MNTQTLHQKSYMWNEFGVATRKMGVLIQYERFRGKKKITISHVKRLNNFYAAIIALNNWAKKQITSIEGRNKKVCSKFIFSTIILPRPLQKSSLPMITWYSTKIENFYHSCVFLINRSSCSKTATNFEDITTRYHFYWSQCLRNISPAE